MFLATKKFKEVEDFWIINFKMAKQLKDYDLASDDKFNTDFRYMMVEQFLQDLYNKSFSNEGNENESVCLEDRLRN